MEGIKIVTIGGGSSYTPELVEGFIKRYEKLPVRELWLVDIEEGREKLETVGALAQRMVKKAGLPMKVILSYDRREALKDADYVTTQMRVGLLEARIKDERIPLSHGMIGQETNGAAGMFKAFRTIPVILDIVKDMKELCPEAWMINFTNPAGMITEAVLRYTDYKKVIGLCNVPINMVNGFARLLDVEPERVTMELSGLNHHIFATDVFVDGQSRLEEILEIYQHISAEDAISMKNFSTLPFSPEFIRGLHCIPCPYHNYYFFTKEQLEEELKEYKEGRVRGEVVKKVEEELFELYKDENLDVKPKQLEMRGGARYSDAACNLICSLHNNTGDIQYVDVRNNGTISNLPADSAVEVACIITSGGPKPIAVGELKPQINGTIQTIKTFERLVCEAAVTGNRDLAVTALNMNPLCASDHDANAVIDELLEAHKKHLPQFFNFIK
ncbi:6-phospho-beta-glucosidase [Lacrimispora celerecrescens]|uniref:6-phospho-beta-glucosidase n=1 Tax=Lacrimispora celerecrescens TaxID=29354 RepID=A0A084JQP7_9FIRM|nr:6-phospho-beta-glucosidase [Lacrimispora celerecrescens]KEZ91281.1 diacetylchitobiose-6-phosphate hydrolase [Lacrimispora celerecrescens]MBW4846127.1 6-phospho-beta-glucosidase [Lachnospiraceae bacterium]